MRRLFFRAERGLPGVRGHVFRIVIPFGVDVGVFHPELRVFLQVGFPADRAGTGRSRSDDAACRVHAADLDLALRLAFRGDGQMDADKTGFEAFVLDPYRGSDGHAQTHLAVRLHLLDGVAAERFVRAGHHRRLVLTAGALRDRGILAHGPEEAVDVVRNAVDVDPVHASGVDAGVELFLREVGDLLMDAVHSLFVSIDVVLRDAAHHLFLRGQAVLHRVGHVVPLQIHVDEAVCSLEVAEILAFADLLGQSAVDIAQRIVDIHGMSPLKTGRTRRARPFVSVSYLLSASSMAFAAVLPAPMARITVAAPVTASPPA